MPFAFSQPYGLSAVAVLFFLTYVGLVVGSFLTVVATRAPGRVDDSSPSREGLWGRSYCPHCDALIPWHRNIPVAAWLLQRGKAACCGQPISMTYPVVEVTATIMTVVPAMMLPLSTAIPAIAIGWVTLTLVAICWLSKRPSSALAVVVISAPAVLALFHAHFMHPAHLVMGAAISGLVGLGLQRAGVSIRPGSAALAGAWLGPLVGTFVGLLAVAGTRTALTIKEDASVGPMSWAVTSCLIYTTVLLVALDLSGAST